MKKYHLAVIGAGTAGIITSTYIKQYWGDKVDVTLIYDHSKPGIGVGESLTPLIYSYLNYVGITREELITNVNATVKLGLLFKNWLNDGRSYFHNFLADKEYTPDNLGTVWDIINNNLDGGSLHSSHMLEQGLIPVDTGVSQSLHIDATLLSKYIENKFRDSLNIIDDIVLDTNVDQSTREIKSLLLKNKGEFSADFYIDATGFQAVLFNKLNAKWNDMSDWMPIDSCIPNPVEFNFKHQPPYTISEASPDGWILQVPLSNRWGSGYLYSSKFTTDEQAFERFGKFVETTYNTKLANTSKVLRFKSGYWDEQWVGNCLAVGLASGFAEPLEATNIHHVVYQAMQFISIHNFNNTSFDKNHYNKIMKKFYDNVYLYLRFCYTTGRTDSEFWRYMTNNTPKPVLDLLEKISSEPLNVTNLQDITFNYVNFTVVAEGLRHIDKRSYYDILNARKLIGLAEQDSKRIKDIKEEVHRTSINHLDYVTKLRNS